MLIQIPKKNENVMIGDENTKKKGSRILLSRKEVASSDSRIQNLMQSKA